MFATGIRRIFDFRSLFRASSIPALLAIVAIATAWFFAEYQNRQAYEQRLRAEVLGHISVVRAKLQGNVNSNIQLVRGLVAMMSIEPDMSPARFASLAAALMEGGSQLRLVAAAPDLVVTMLYPLEGNEAALGLDYSRNDAQREAALRARDTGELILAGPVDLVQGGAGFIARFPVTTRHPDGTEDFWGIVSAVVDVERLYRDSGLLDTDLPISIALSGRDGRGGVDSHFFGPAEVLAQGPVLSEVTLPSGSWQIAAIPKDGWEAVPKNIWMLRLLMLCIGGLIMIPTFITGRLIEERQRHIGELKNRQAELRRLSRRLGLALDTSQVGVWEWDIESGDLFWDDRMNELYRMPADRAPRTYLHWAARIHPEDRERAEQDFHNAVDTRGRYLSNYRLVLPGGELRHVRAIGTVYQDAGAPLRIVGVNWDVTADVKLNEELRLANSMSEARNAELAAAKERIEFNALHDSLTGMPNRRYLDDIVADHAIRFARGEEVAVVLQIDLDRFKQINDTLGHAAGDAMLSHAAAILCSTVEPGDFVARVGGDEFVIICRFAPDSERAELARLAELAENIIASMQKPLVFQGHECRVGVSIGIATDMDSVADPMRLLVNADIALYRAKSKGRNRFQFFNDALQEEIVITKRVADEILSGIDAGQFIAYYQPQFDAESLEIIGVEALARWQHPTKGLLAPAAFMKIADELNAVATIDRMVLEHTLHDFETWERVGIGIPKVSVNVSARRLNDEELIRSLERLDLRPGTVSFELVESIFLDDNDELVTWNVDRIKELGIDIEIDDFGTGYASIVSLMKLKPRRLKIDRQFIMPIARSPAQRHLVGSIVDIGKSLGIEVLAEGVETMEHARILRQLGCNALQGYAFARPMSSQDLIGFARSQCWREAS